MILIISFFLICLGIRSQNLAIRYFDFKESVSSASWNSTILPDSVFLANIVAIDSESDFSLVLTTKKQVVSGLQQLSISLWTSVQPNRTFSLKVQAVYMRLPPDITIVPANFSQTSKQILVPGPQKKGKERFALFLTGFSSVTFNKAVDLGRSFVGPISSQSNHKYLYTGIVPHGSWVSYNMLFIGQDFLDSTGSYLFGSMVSIRMFKASLRLRTPFDHAFITGISQLSNPLQKLQFNESSQDYSAAKSLFLVTALSINPECLTDCAGAQGHFFRSFLDFLSSNKDTLFTISMVALWILLLIGVSVFAYRLYRAYEQYRIVNLNPVPGDQLPQSDDNIPEGFRVSLTDLDATKVETPGELCCICLDRSADRILYPCKHAVYCGSCVKHIFESNDKYSCPVCRSRITKIKKY